ncbi:hypothetical protein TcWFU_003973 [Taenia crassiceps]|uniref:Secreted protein n=1 Tax=Taenia crassiceps TaxID=6207 RepID=A0ABR4Q7T8_9CEST
MVPFPTWFLAAASLALGSITSALTLEEALKDAPSCIFYDTAPYSLVSFSLLPPSPSLLSALVPLEEGALPWWKNPIDSFHAIVCETLYSSFKKKAVI